MSLSFALIIIGISLQFFSFQILPGLFFIIAGNLFLLVKGYNNKVDLGKYRFSSKWERVSVSKFQEIKEFGKKIAKWDRSFLDVSNGLGCFVFLILLISGIVLFIHLGADLKFGTENTILVDYPNENRAFFMIIINVAVLLFPHWITGLRKVDTKDILMMKINLIEELLSKLRHRLDKHSIDYLILLRGKRKQIPDDVKFKISIKDQHEAFLGLYGQIVINNVSGRPFPYFYTVIVAKKELGLKAFFRKIEESHGITKEFKTQKDAEVLVIRQTTTKTTGYHTEMRKMEHILAEGLNHSEYIAVKKF